MPRRKVSAKFRVRLQPVNHLWKVHLQRPQCPSNDLNITSVPPSAEFRLSHRDGVDESATGQVIASDGAPVLPEASQGETSWKPCPKCERARECAATEDDVRFMRCED